MREYLARRHFFTEISSARVSFTVSVKLFVVTSHVIDGDVTHRDGDVARLL